MHSKWIRTTLSLIALSSLSVVTLAVSAEDELKAFDKLKSLEFQAEKIKTEIERLRRSSDLRAIELDTELRLMKAEIERLKKSLGHVEKPQEAQPGITAIPVPEDAPASRVTPLARPKSDTPPPPPEPSDPTAKLLAEQLKSLSLAVSKRPGTQWQFATMLDQGIFEFEQQWLSRSLQSLEEAQSLLRKERASLAKFLSPGDQDVKIAVIEVETDKLVRKAQDALDSMPPTSVLVTGESGTWKDVTAEQAQEPFWYAMLDLAESQLGLRLAEENEQPRYELELKYTLAQEGIGALPKLKLSYTLTLRHVTKERQVLLERKPVLTFEPPPGDVPPTLPDFDLFLAAFDGHELLDLSPVPPEVIGHIGHSR